MCPEVDQAGHCSCTHPLPNWQRPSRDHVQIRQIPSSEAWKTKSVHSGCNWWANCRKSFIPITIARCWYRSGSCWRPTVPLWDAVVWSTKLMYASAYVTNIDEKKKYFHQMTLCICLEKCNRFGSQDFGRLICICIDKNISGPYTYFVSFIFNLLMHCHEREKKLKFL